MTLTSRLARLERGAPPGRVSAWTSLHRPLTAEEYDAMSSRDKELLDLFAGAGVPPPETDDDEPRTGG